eukprot:8283500-Pyramimonas_sp.AAC.1
MSSYFLTMLSKWRSRLSSSGIASPSTLIFWTSMTRWSNGSRIQLIHTRVRTRRRFDRTFG